MAAVTQGVVRTFLFADLRDYSTFVQSHGDRAAAALLRAFRRHVRAAIATERGSEIHTEGDSFYVVFRTPGAAIRCALAVQRRAEKYAAAHPHQPIRTGIGINSGEAVEHGGGYVGSAVIVAKRLADQATAGQVLITETVRTLLRTGAVASVRDLGTWRLKGIAEPVRVYEVERKPTAEVRALGPVLPLPAVLLSAPDLGTSGQLVSPEIIQRERPLAQLTEHLAAALVGEMRLVAVLGEGGIGKSRLCREIAKVAERDGFYVFGGRSYGSADRAYAPFIGALRPYVRARGIEVLRRVLGGLLPEARRIIPELDLPASSVDTEALPDDERGDRVVRAIQLLLEDAASIRPLLLVLEDFQYADAGTRDLLRYLASTLRVGACVAFTVRDDEIGSRHPTRALLGDLIRDRRLALIPLRPLDREGVAKMSAALMPGRTTPDLERALYERSEGVPYYVEELLRSAVEDPTTPADRVLPRSVRDSVAARIARLEEQRGPEIGRFLQTLAVAAAPLPYETIVRLSAREEAQLSDDLARAIDLQILERAPTQREMYRFRHALTREAIEDEIAPALRRQLALRAAEAFEATLDVGSNAATIARLFGQAGESERAVRYGRLAGRTASAMGAFGLAIEVLQDAAVLGRGAADEPNVLHELGKALRAAGRVGEAESALSRARAAALQRGDDEFATRISIDVADALRLLGRRDEAAAVARVAVEASHGEPDETSAQAETELAALAWAEARSAEAADHARTAVAIATARGDVRTAVEANTILGAALARLGQPAGFERLEEAIRNSLANGLSAEAANAYYELSRAELLHGRSLQARHASEAGLALAREHGLELMQSRLLTHLTTLAMNDGHYGEARRLAEQAVALARPDTIAATSAKLALAHVLANQGQHGDAMAMFDDVAARIGASERDRQSIFFAQRAQPLQGLDRLDEAWASARQAIEIALATPGTGATAWLNAAEVAEARRDVSGLKELASSFEMYFSGRDTAFIRLVRAELAAILAMCEGRDAAPLFDDLAHMYTETIGAVVRAQYRRATSALLRMSDPGLRGRASVELNEARAALVERDALRYVELIDRALARRPRARRAMAPLAEREMRVALLMARGLTDRKIATEMRVTPHEAARLGATVRRKLGVSSRSQVASWVVQRQATGTKAVAAVS